MFEGEDDVVRGWTRRVGWIVSDGSDGEVQQI